MNTKKIISTLQIPAFIILAIALLAGCGKTDTSGNQNQKKDSANVQNKNQTNPQSNDKQTEQKKDVMKTTDSPENPAAAIAVVKITTAQCDECKDNITKALKKVDGVGEISIDVDKKVAKIKFDMSKTDVSKIENAITAAGYDANDKKADPDAYKNLDDCCKIPKDRKAKK